MLRTYDAEGNRVREEYRDASTALQRFTNFAYDNFNRLQYAYFNDSPVPPTSGSVFYKNKYNTDGTREAERDPLGHVKSFTYDEFKRLKTVTETVATDTLTTSYEYDAQDNLTSVTDPRGLVTTYGYGDSGWRLSSDSPDTGHTAYTYDQAGNLKSSTGEDDVTVSRTYDALNRLKTVTYPDTSLNVENFYDSAAVSNGIGRRTSMTDPSGTTTFAYDRRGLLKSERKLSHGWMYETGYDYDGNGNLTEVRYPASNTLARQGRVDYTFDQANRVTDVSADVNGVTVSVAHDFHYKPFGPRTQLTFGNELIDSRSFDSRYRFGNWTLGNQSLGNLLSYTHGFDDDGNLTSRVDNIAHANDRTFDYDEIHRLTTALSPVWPGSNLCGGKTYTYDTNGNRTCKWESGSAVDYTYEFGSNRLTSSTNGVVSAFYSYDANGNTTSDGAHSYEYNDAARLASVDAGATATYTYDGDGRRVQKLSADGHTYYFHDPSGRLLTEMVLGETSGTGIGKDYVYANDAPIARVDWSVMDNLDECPPGLGSGDCDPQVAYAELLFYHTDHLGTPIAMTAGDPTFSVPFRWRAEYLPFGELFSNSIAQVENNLRFPGQYFDSETGLHQNWFRDYQPKTGRYMEADPIDQSVILSAYGYVSLNPTNSSDLTGLLENFTLTLNKRPTTKLKCDCGNEFTVFSGVGSAVDDPAQIANTDIGPIPIGRFFIADRQSGGRLGWLREWLHRVEGNDQTRWYALVPIDGNSDDCMVVNGVVRCGFRMHPGSRSRGCVTFVDSGEFFELRRLLDKTTKGVIPGTNRVYYGTVTVQ